ncbi:ferredoxin [Sporichthya brevicatena]|uniref:Ferredoxin n=1 Tax=Sporichthya brevicatena TaxID=171442 RepID=A0ABN1GA99_9ACTN
MTAKLWIDSDVCMSSGRCVADLPRVFRFDDEEIAELVPDADIDAEFDAHRDLLVAAVRNCPAGAIHLQEDGVEVEA